MPARQASKHFRLATPVTEQLVFELAAPEPPSFANFLPGGNAEALAAVKALAAGDAAETGVMLWGSPGAGKTHLLRAAVDAVSARGGAAAFVAEPGELLAQDPGDARRSGTSSRSTASTTPRPTRRRGCSRSSTACANDGGHLLVASRLPLAALPLREDLRTRLGWGLVYELTPLADADKPPRWPPMRGHAAFGWRTRSSGTCWLTAVATWAR